MGFFGMFQQTTALCQETTSQFNMVLVGDAMIESTTVIENSIVLTYVAEAVKANYIPDRRYIVLDSVLKTQIDTSISLPFRHKHQFNLVRGSTYFDFFYDYRRGDYSIVEIGPTVFKIHSGSLPNKMYEPQMVITDYGRFVLDRRVNKERIVYLFNTDKIRASTSVNRRKKRTKVFPLYFNTISESSDVAYIWREKSQKVDDVHVNIWNDNGEAKHQFNFEIPEKHVHGIDVRRLDENRVMLSGTYSKLPSKKASGAFFAIVEDGAVLSLNTYSFSEMPHYFDNLDRYEKEEMKRKLARLKKHHKSTEILAHCKPQKLIESGASYLLPIEFYVESYLNEYGVTRNGNTVAGSPQSKIGYDFSHALILRVDDQGQLKYDYFLPLELEYIAPTISQIVKTNHLGDTLQVGYAAKNNLYFGHIEPANFASLKKDSSFYSLSDEVVRKEAKFVYLKNGTIAVFGFKKVKANSGVLKKEDIYFIETLKVR
jgi:hypothetical protein